MYMDPERETESEHTTKNLTINKINDPLLLWLSPKTLGKSINFQFTSLGDIVVFTSMPCISILKFFFPWKFHKLSPSAGARTVLPLEELPFLQVLCSVVGGPSLSVAFPRLQCQLVTGINGFLLLLTPGFPHYYPFGFSPVLASIKPAS